MSTYGLLPHHLYALVWPLIAVVLWKLFLPLARKKQVISFHNATLAVSFWEEILFRGIIFGEVLTLGYGNLVAAIVSSLLFGAFHFRNLWWTKWKRCLEMSAYTALVVGPFLAASRIFTGDIYLGILLHFLHNTLVTFPPGWLKKYTNKVPKDSELAILHQRHRRS